MASTTRYTQTMEKASQLERNFTLRERVLEGRLEKDGKIWARAEFRRLRDLVAADEMGGD